jgi:enamine deaminase RidA (YjgF/YER057c/UK114 family)
MAGSSTRRPEAPFQIAQVEGSDAIDLFVHAAPAPSAKDARAQVRSVAECALQGLRSLGAVPADVTAGWVYLAEKPSWDVRCELASAWNEPDAERLPFTFLVQPPATSRRFCEIHLQASRPRTDRCSVVWKGAQPGPLCTTVLRAGARHLRMQSLLPRTDGRPKVPLADQTFDMFAQASHALTDRGLSFHDVVRTWIYLRDIDRDYAAFNEGRRRFFQHAGVARLPASTGIQGAMLNSDGPLGLDLYAVGSTGEAALSTMHPGPMGDATDYGSMFARGAMLRQPGEDLAFLSGTASIDPQGRVVAPGDGKGQVACMLGNAAGVLAHEGLGLANAVSVTAYLKHAEMLPDFLQAAQAAGLPASIPTAIVTAGICRPEWLCEMELVAARSQRL